MFQKMVSEVVQVEFRVIFCLWQDVNIHVKPLHLSVSQKSVAMDQVLVSQYVSGTVDTIAGKSAYSVSLTKFNIFNTKS